MARLWTCGFESQSLTAGVEVAIVTGAPTISTAVKRAGAASMRCQPTAATAFFEHQMTAGVVMRTLHRFYLRVDTLPSATVTIYSIGQNSYFPGLLRLRTTGALTLHDGQSGLDLGTATAPLTLGRWYRIELDYEDVAATAGSLVSPFKLYLDGVLMASTTCSNINGFSRVRAGASSTVSTLDMFIDDIAVNDTTGTVQNGLPGPGNVIHLRPDSAGDNAGWATTVGGTANWQRVSEITPDDATTYNATTAAGTTTIDDHNLSSTTAAGVSGQRVTLVAVGARIGSTAATAASLVYRIKSQTAGTILESGSVSVALNGWATHKAAAPYLHQLTSYTDPQAGGPWTTALLDTAQIGYRANVSQATVRRVSALWALVETIPITTTALGTASSTATAQPLGRRRTQALGTAVATETVRPLLPVVGAPVSSLVDRFDDGVVDPVLWPDAYEPGGYSEVGGRARVVCTTAYNAFASADAYRLRESSVSVRMYPPAAGGAVAEAWAQLLVQTTTLGTDAIMEVNRATGLLVMASRVLYYDPAQATLTYSPMDHAWLRIRETGRALYWETSADGLTWTTRHTEESPAWVGDTTLQVQLISHRDGGTPDVAEFDNLNAPPGTAAALGPATETGTGQSLGQAKRRTLLLSTESEAAQPLARSKRRALGIATAVESGQALARAKRRTAAPALGADAAQQLLRRKTKATVTAVETDAAQLLGRSRRRALGTASETVAARPLVPVTYYPLTPAVETATARPLGQQKRKSLAPSTETATAQALTGGRSAALASAAGTETALPLGRAKLSAAGPAVAVTSAQPLVSQGSRSLGAAAESETARPFVGLKRQSLGTATETATAQLLTGAIQRPAGTVAEQDAARPLGRGKRLALGTADEVIAARSLAASSAADMPPAVETDSAQLLGRRKRTSLGTAHEAVEARPLIPTKARPLVPATEAESGLPLGRRKPRVLGTAYEAAAALPLTGASTKVLGVATETAAARSLDGTSVGALSPASADETARPLRVVRRVLLGTAVEVSTARVGPYIRLAPATEVSTALTLTGVRQRPADHLTPSTTGPRLTPGTDGARLAVGATGPALTTRTTDGG